MFHETCSTTGVNEDGSEFKQTLYTTQMEAEGIRKFFFYLDKVCVENLFLLVGAFFPKRDLFGRAILLGEIIR